MKRIRFLAGILALTALCLSIAQGVWASLCSSAMEMGLEVVSAPANETTSTDHCAHHAVSEPPQEDSPAPLSCPFMPMTITSCAGSVSLPAQVRLGVSSPLDHLVLPPSYHALSETLFSTTLFHPPRA